MGDNHNNVNLPPGFRFSPTDEELVVHFLQRRATTTSLLPYHPNIIPDLDLYPYDPWDLDGKALGEGNKWYFYSRRTQTRITSNGYWNPLVGDEPIFSTNNTSKTVGTKKYYMFYIGEPIRRSVKTNWIMEEYRLSDGASSSRTSKRRQSNIDFSKWVVCRVYEHSYDPDDDGTELSCLDEVFLSLEDDFDEISFPN